MIQKTLAAKKCYGGKLFFSIKTELLTFEIEITNSILNKNENAWDYEMADGGLMKGVGLVVHE